MELEFKTEVNDVDLFSIRTHLGLVGEFDKLDIESGKPVATVEYGLEIEARSYGIKGISIYPKRVAIEIEWEVSIEDTTDDERLKLIAIGGVFDRFDDVFRGIVNIDTDTDKDWLLNNNMVFSEGGSLSPENVQFDFENKQICIN